MIFFFLFSLTINFAANVSVSGLCIFTVVDVIVLTLFYGCITEHFCNAKDTISLPK